MITARFGSEAASELEAAFRFYGVIAPQVADAFMRGVERALDRVCVLPRSGAPVTATLRRVAVEGFPYWLVYKLQRGEGLLVIAVAHESRRPGYWRARKPRAHEIQPQYEVA